MRIIHLGRRLGKTTRLIEWVERGKPTQMWPGWSRIILTPTMEEADTIRRTLRARGGKADTYRWVFSWGEWQRAQISAAQSLDLEVGIDNLDILLNNLIEGRGTVKVVTLDRVD
jgi:hypothetical protein